MSQLDTLLEDRLKLELLLQLQFNALRKSLRQQLQDTEKRQVQELEKRIHQNALLSKDIDKKSSDEKELNYNPKFKGIRRSKSVSALTSENETSCNPQKRFSSTSSVWLPLNNWKCFSVLNQPCERSATSKTTQLIKEEEAEAECQKKFSAVPVPRHVTQPIYQKMLELSERERKQGHEQRKQFLLSIQKPFSFQEREKRKTEKMRATLNQVSQEPKNNACVKKTHRKESPVLKDQQENPSQTRSPKHRIAERTRKKKLGFLDNKPSFQPKIIHQVPNFSRLHKALQTDAADKTKSKDVTKCQPFILRTSALPARQSVKSLETSQVPTLSNLSRSKSLGALTLVSSDTLPTYITDAVRKRCVAIKKSMELSESKNQESVEWLRNHQIRSQAMKKTLALHAKLLDPHSSLKEVSKEHLKRHWEADRQRTRDYRRELRDMKARVSERPYLFEQVKQKNAKACAEQTYRSKLKKAGLKEQFVEETGEAHRSDDDTETSDHSTENGIQNGEENVDDGEKIEDVEEKSVKSKGEAML
ncbi:protein FAM161B [Cololabis saira]|uniref:protein FAM161B n=1 Tax=Cololabis saira TaxID=129043 RepID=UPI002AD581FD|nr:protein FAM161B [Cololabis saira]